MTRRRRWFRRVKRVATTVALGLLIGWLVPTFIRSYSGEPEIANANDPAFTQAEVNLARDFVVAYLFNDQETLGKYAGNDLVSLRAAEQANSFAKAEALTLISANRYATSEIYGFAVKLTGFDGATTVQGFRVLANQSGLTVIEPPGAQ